LRVSATCAILGNVLRVVLLLLAVSGCDRVFLEEPAPPICGPYGEPRPLAFVPELVEPHGFSVRRDGSLGAVTARVAGVTGVYVVEERPPGSGAWGLASPARNVGLPRGALAGGTIAELDLAGQDELYAWTGTPDRTEVQGYRFAGTSWGGTNVPLLRNAEFDITVGNVVEVVEVVEGVLVAQRKRGVLTLAPADGGKSLLVFADQVAPYVDAGAERTWDDIPERTRPLNEDASVHPSRGVLTQDLAILVYAARVDGGDSELYASRIDDVEKTWRPGQRLLDVSTAGDEVEPWIDGDCSTLYFHRDGVTYRADRLVE